MASSSTLPELELPSDINQHTILTNIAEFPRALPGSANETPSESPKSGTPKLLPILKKTSSNPSIRNTQRAATYSDGVTNPISKFTMVGPAVEEGPEGAEIPESISALVRESLAGHHRHSTSEPSHYHDSHGVQFAEQNDYFGDESGNEGGRSHPGTPRRRSTAGAMFRRSRRSADIARGEGEDEGGESEDEATNMNSANRPSLFSKIRALSHSAAQHSRSLSGFGGENSSSEEETTPTGPLSPVDQAGEDSAPETPTGATGTPRIARPRRRATMGDFGSGNESDRSRRPSNFRRITALAHSRRSSQDLGSASPNPAGGGGASAAKWRSLKASLRMMGAKKKEEAKIDREKSAELVAELTAGIPAALMLASMFQRDEHGNKRIPILLEQLKIKITDSKVNHKARAHTVFRIELEYGSGLTRMKWVIHREFRDFFNLHSRYRLQDLSNTTFGGSKEANQLPRFPRTTIPYLRGVRGLGNAEDDADDDSSGNETATNANSSNALARRDSDMTEVEHSGGGGLGGLARKLTRRRPANRRMSTSASNVAAGGAGDQIHTGDIGAGIALGIGALAGAAVGTTPMLRRDVFSVKQRQKLEKYLQGLIRIMIFRPDSNRLCKFLELSALGIRLAAENSYHGKEGFLIIRSSKGSDFHRAWNPATLAKRHSPKWFIVRHSYIVCVDSPEEMNVYDVFLVDSDFAVDAKKSLKGKPKDIAIKAPNPAHPQHHTLKIQNAERRMKLLAKNERQLLQFHESIKYMSTNTNWAKEQRFGSFAPVRHGVWAQWLVDGRDYMWNVSRAISLAKDVIYIHDWWLSPEIYLRRPPAVSQKWRLDRLLQQKASEGVKIFIIVYRNIGAAIPIDSSWTKYSLLDLHPNIFVQRSPNQFRQNTFFWAHHEKILVVDHMVAFVGGIDLCFGRWDTPQHTLVDDKFSGFEEQPAGKVLNPDDCQLWPGKDYSNPRVQDFYELNKPYDEMYDRQKVPRMPWHDIHMQVAGQPARDLTRHFVQRWNYLLRQRKPSRPTPFLLPPPDFTQAEIDALGIGGTCEIQILRSACWWSLGTPDKTEHSIMNAYLKAIETSDHFVYIENQFFITSCEIQEGTARIENSIGDALVERIIRAFKNDEDWKAILVIPLMPGFQNTVDQQEGSSIRLIMQCQFRSICRGESSIFGRLKAHGIEPEEYIQFYGLRTWGKIGPQKQLVTEQLYIHAKCMIVDDRLAIIGSANINERSMLGYRDSEVAAVVRDTEVSWSTMAGKPYQVGRFPHTLRLRLMREHLGVDVDELMAEERAEDDRAHSHSQGHSHGWPEDDSDIDGPSSNRSSAYGELDPVSGHENGAGPSVPPLERPNEAYLRAETLTSFNHDVDWEQNNNPNIAPPPLKKQTYDARVISEKHRSDVAGLGIDHMKDINTKADKGKDKVSVPTPGNRVLGSEGHEFSSSPSQGDGGQVKMPMSKADAEKAKRDRSSTLSSDYSVKSDDNNMGNLGLPPPPRLHRNMTMDFGLPMNSQLPPLPNTNDFDIGGPAGTRTFASNSGTTASHPLLAEIRQPVFDNDAFLDPLNDSFILDTWHEIAVNNAKIYREVFRCMPDSEVKTWKEYKEYQAYADKFAQSEGGEAPSAQEKKGGVGKAAAAGVGAGAAPVDKVAEKVHAAGDAINPTSNTDKSKHATVENFNEKDGAINERANITSNSPKPSPDENNTKDPEKEALKNNSVASSNNSSATLGEKDKTAGGTADGLPRTSSTSFKNELPKSSSSNVNQQGSQRRRKRTNTRGRREFNANDEVIDKKSAEELLSLVQGHLVVWPYDWLITEAEGGNWLYSIDQLAPLEIYN